MTSKCILTEKILYYTRYIGIVLALALPGSVCLAQVDQGAITGQVQDTSGAVVPNAQVTVTNVDTGLAFQTKTNGSGTYVVSPVKIGNYTVTATAEGFQTVTRDNLHVDAQQRLGVNITLQPGAVSQTITVSEAPPLLEMQTGAVGQVVSTQTINNTPLNGRNWVYIAQLTAGVAPPFGNTRGSGSGDFVANGQRAEQNTSSLTASTTTPIWSISLTAPAMSCGLPRTRSPSSACRPAISARSSATRPAA